MKILMVGSGAVGQVFGLHLRQAGVDLAYYARPESADRLKLALGEGGLPLTRLTWFRRQNLSTHRLAHYQVVTDLDAAQNFGPDQIWFTTPSPVYYSGWFREFVQDVSSKRVVCFAPEGRRPEFIPDSEEGDRFIFGGITLIAWQGDLAGGGGRPDGVRYWLPPAAIPLMGDRQACREVAALLKKGGLRAAVRDDTFQATQAATTALLSALAAGLELSGWSFKGLRRGPWLKRAAHGAREGISGQLAELGFITRALLRIGLTPAVLKLTSSILPILTPFDLERYLKFHYLKTREQTLALLDLFARDALENALGADNLRALQHGLARSRQPN